MSTHSCQICGRQLPSTAIRDQHQLRCEAAAYDDLSKHTRKRIALAWLADNRCHNCGDFHATESAAIRCGERQHQIDTLFSVFTHYQLNELREREHHA